MLHNYFTIFPKLILTCAYDCYATTPKVRMIKTNPVSRYYYFTIICSTDKNPAAFNTTNITPFNCQAFHKETLKNDSISLASPSESVFFDLAARFNRFMCSFWAL